MMKSKYPSQSDLMNIMDYNPLTGVFTYSKPRRGVKNGSAAGCMNKDGYIVIRINRTLYYAHRLAWIYHYGVIPEMEIDHINGVVNDNKISNLREVNHQDNLKNMRLSSANTSGYTGVYFDKRRNLYKSQIKNNGKDMFLGYFSTAKEAASARDAANIKLNYHELHGTSKPTACP